VALVLGEVAVARGLGEAVLFTDGGHADHLDAEVEVARHLGDHEQAAGSPSRRKKAIVGGRVDEELGHDGCHAVKEVRAELVLQPGFGRAAEADAL
jgi:hypothetical protein